MNRVLVNNVITKITTGENGSIIDVIVDMCARLFHYLLE